jgi:hypothetical protein
MDPLYGSYYIFVKNSFISQRLEFKGKGKVVRLHTMQALGGEEV